MAVRSTIEVIGAREHNLQNVSIEIPRDQLIVFTGVSGSGKSSLAFDTIYAEGQRRYMESLSSYARRFVDQIRKPDIDFMFGLSPVVSIEQKTVARNPRSTVGTLTDIAAYLNLLFATNGIAHCPYCRREVPIRPTAQIAEAILSLPAGTVVELRAPIFPVYGEDWEFVFAEIRKAGFRRLIVDGNSVDISQPIEDTHSWKGPVDVIVDKFVVRREIEKQLKVGIGNALGEGERFMSLVILDHPAGFDAEAFYHTFGCPEHHIVMGDLSSEHFMFNNPTAACRTCMGLGTYRQVHPRLLVPDPRRASPRDALCRRRSATIEFAIRTGNQPGLFAIGADALHGWTNLRIGHANLRTTSIGVVARRAVRGWRAASDRRLYNVGPVADALLRTMIVGTKPFAAIRGRSATLDCWR